ncbi:MAG: DUF547 domain-containing protein [Cyclobacteriaceae bacterium]|nr:DUF547 domain-containing protein [Cyclobacteriaceae bacterium]
MKTYFIVLLLVSSLVVNAQDKEFYTKVDHIMSTYVHHGRVDYSAIKANPTELNQIVAIIKKTDLKTLSDQQFEAFVINAYNMLVIYNVVQGYPIESVIKEKGFFSDKSFSIGKVVLSLDDLEKKILFGKFKDSRLHLALSCAAIGCPPLSNTVYMPESIDEQLKEQAIISINDPDFIRIDRSKKEVQLSQIFEWYNFHFGSSKEQQIAYLNKYLKELIDADYSVSYYQYDWNLNDYKR